MIIYTKRVKVKKVLITESLINTNGKAEKVFSISNEYSDGSVRGFAMTDTNFHKTMIKLIEEQNENNN